MPCRGVEEEGQAGAERWGAGGDRNGLSGAEQADYGCYGP